jgi:uncharacterized protein (DUF1800 family)
MSSQLGPTREACYLWRCAGFGADASTLQRTIHQGYERTVGEMFRQIEPQDRPGPPVTVVPPGITGTFLEMAGLITWWINRMAQAAHPLREKMTFFWHSYFTSSADPVFSPGLLLEQNQLFYSQAFDRFEDLLLSVAKNPAMMIYLDGFRNSKVDGGERPNENFARELCELYTIGPGHYHESDVKAAARSFTGWGLNWWSGPSFSFSAQNHDSGPKQFLGRTGCFQGDDVLSRLAAHPATGRHLCRRLWQFFAGATPSAKALERLAAVFQRSCGNMAVVVKSMFLDPDFRKAAQQADQAFLSPVEYLVSLLRVMETSLVHVKDWPVIDRLKKMGQMPFLPPSVKGWPYGRAWINSATLRERLELVQQLVASRRPQLQTKLAGCRGLDELLAVAQRSDSAPEIRKVLGRVVGDSVDRFALILQGPEFHQR